MGVIAEEFDQLWSFDHIGLSTYRPLSTTATTRERKEERYNCND